MEKQIKTLYIVTIIAIIAFLGMQTYWLYGRYEFSLKEYYRNLSGRIEKCVDDYNAIRAKKPVKIADSLKREKGNTEVFSVPTFSLQQEYGDTIKTKRTSKIFTYLYSAHELLGLEPDTPLTEEQKQQALDLAQVQMSTPVDS
ncbi:MAG: hypothetical protein K2O12_05165, partial [Muribaculaceae bacterium]|nr:hypothetical protein [Muribaculaceae bacterium]